MENQNYGVGLGDAGVLSLLSRIGPYGGGYGGYGGGYGGSHGSFAGPSANAVRIDRNADTNREQHENILRSQADIAAIIRDQSINNRLNSQDIKLCELQKDISDCCCATQRAVDQSKAELIALNKDTIISGLERDLAEARCNSGGHSYGRGRGVKE